MSTVNSNFKNKVKGILKYLIFNVIFFGAFFALNAKDVDAANITEDTASVVFHQSNHHGNNGGDYSAFKSVGKCADGTDSNCYSDWYIQGTGVTEEDVVTFTLTVPYYNIDGIVLFEEGFTSAGGKSYDAYKKTYNGTSGYSWGPSVGGSMKQGGMIEDLAAADAPSCSEFETAVATYGELKANDGNYYSLMCITENDTEGEKKIEIKYAYTIRKSGYGLKNIKIVLYYGNAYDPDGDSATQAVAYDYELKFVVSKPVNENQFTWIKDADDTCVKHASATGRPLTEDICVTYINGTPGNVAKELTFTLPQETAYLHDVGVDPLTIDNIKNNTIYGTNTFRNVDGDADDTNDTVIYYYYNFIHTSTDIMDPYVQYVITLSVDASGYYEFFVKDVFGNTHTTINDDSNDDVYVEDVRITNIIVDYTNEHNLTLMTASGDYPSGWVNDWAFAIDSSYTIDFKKIAKDSVTIEIHVFHKIVINNGIHDTTTNEIAKQPLGYNDGVTGNPSQYTDAGIQIWRVADVAGDTGESTNAVSCGTDTNGYCYYYNGGAGGNITFAAGDYPSSNGRNNKITFVVKSNGRYRIKVTDNYTNTTDTLSDDNKNPLVEVSVVDRTAPVVGRENGNNADGVLNGTDYSTNVESFDYVVGGGKVNPVNPSLPLSSEYWKTADNYTTVYYNNAGEKVFDYQNAIDLAQIKVLDPVYSYKEGSVEEYYSEYNVNYGYTGVTGGCYDFVGNASSDLAAGKYCDPSSSAKSDRNSSGTAGTASRNLHTYIIDNNIMSFSAGLIIQAVETDYDSTSVYSTTVTAKDSDFNYINSKASDNYAGYLKIVFKNSSGVEICTAGSDADTNKACFNLINQYIDDVEDFSMTFTAQDYMHDGTNDSFMHTSADYVVKVRVIDNTAPGIINKTAADPIKYTNETTTCRLEIDNDLQLKDILLDCYLLTVSDVYSFKDNNVDNSAGNSSTLSTLAGGKQYYDVASAAAAYYHNKIALSIKEAGNADANGDGWIDIDDVEDSKPHLKKSGYHEFKVVISDHWNTVDPNIAGGGTAMGDNTLTIYLTYYVNPRTLLIEPLANDKMYGENEPLFDYCVYVNKNNTTFNLEGHFFEVDFINEYFTHIYCTKDVYVEIKDENKYSRTEVTGSDYVYHTYTQSNSGTYLKVNNTFVEITNSKRYTMEYEQNDNGRYFKNDSVNYVEIKSGYLYEDDSCLFAATDGMIDGNYIKVPGVTGCHVIAASNRYTPKYTQSDSGTYLKYNENTISAGYDNVNISNGGNANSALVNSNVFQGKLARVESRCYNKFDDNNVNNTTSTNFAALLSCEENSTETDKGIRNDNVGQYHIVLGTLSVEEAAAGGTDYNGDYVIKLNTNYVASDYQLGGEQTIVNKVDNILADDGLKTESNVNFTIRQAVLTIKANGSSKRFGEQDPYSNVWNNLTTAINNANTGYLKGYTISGYRYNGNENDVDSKYIVNGTLRRTVGEDVGVYYICNISGNPASIVESDCAGEPGLPEEYNSTTPYYFANFDNYTAGGVSTAAALTIRTNGDIYGNETGRTLNTGTRNYAILFIKAYFTIEATDLIIQPGINQGKEYAATEYNDPLWSFVLYGENVTLSSDGTKWETIIKTCETINDNSKCANVATGFSGYTETKTLDVNTVSATLGTDPYDHESEVYYARRKTSPNDTYKYIEYIQIDNVQRYIKLEDTTTGKYYFYETANTLDNGQYVFAFGNYYEILAANRYNNAEGGTQTNTGNYLKVEIKGRLVNQKDNLFSDGFKNIKDETSNIVREVGGSVDWYSYVTIYNYKETNTTPAAISYYTLASNGNVDQCLITLTTVTAETNAGATGLTNCVNYNVVYRDNAPTKSGTVYTTDEGQHPEYKPDGNLACSVAGNYSKQCVNGPHSATNKIMFEIFKREIVLEFIDDNYTFVYGERYDYYDGLTYPSGSAAYNTNTNGIFYVKDGTGSEFNRVGSSERDIFLCYSDLGDYLVDCTNNADYGITAGHKWTDIGLEFHLHSIVSAPNSGYYSTATDKALPAGEYYVYASISADAQQNYKFTYRGGTLKIAPKVTNVQLTGYTMEYGESAYDSYGVGTNYSEYTMLYDAQQCMRDASYLSGSGLIGNDAVVDTTSCSETGNIVGNKYGFVIEGLDRSDTIATNFNGRPVREGARSGNVGNYNDVGYYKIGIGSIANINDSRVQASSFKQCVSNLSGGVVSDSTCVFAGANQDSGLLTSDNAKNYDITYSLNNNEGSYLFILPADVTIEVEPEQTKMYGCSYFEEHLLSNTSYYAYTYAGGYTAGTLTSCVDVDNYDSAYTYYVTGDKDNSALKYTVKYDYVNNVLVYTYTETVDTRKEIFNGENLYRITYSETNVSYANAKLNKGKYEGQSVGVYTITLGSLNAKDNVNTQMCDAYNNPVLNGGSACRNYNVNYYGESATNVEDTHTYKNSINTINASELQLYVLNYAAATDTNYNNQYVLINGKYVRVADLSRTGDDVLISTYVSINDLASKRYEKQRKYVEDASGSYIYLDGWYKELSTLSDLRYSASIDDASYKDNNGNYLRVVKSDGKVNFIQISTISKFKENTGTGYVTCTETNCNYVYVPNAAGEYVYINNEYVQLSSLRKYKESSSGVFAEATAADIADADVTKYVQVYEVKALNTLNRFVLDATEDNMYALSSNAIGNNMYVFVNGSYVPYNSFVASNTQTTITANKAALKSDATGVSSGSEATAVKFYITARTVQVHPEYNIRPFGDDDPIEYITCNEIKSAYGLSDFDGRNGYYCGTDTTNNAKNNETKIDLGVTMYYAIQNSLAKAPWTSWTDYDSDTSTAVMDQSRSGYNDIQFDVLTGEVIRRYDPTATADTGDSRNGHENDRAGKYTYDFINVTTSNTLNGSNYMIEYVTEKKLNETYVKTSASTSEKISNLLYEVCDLGSAHCAIDTLGLFRDPTTPDYTKGMKIRNNTFELKVQDVEIMTNGTPTIPNGSYTLADQSGAGETISISLITKYDAAAATVDDVMNYWYLGFYAVDTGASRSGEEAKWWNEDKRPFSCSYDGIVNKTCKYTDADSNEVAYGETIADPKFATPRAVYFEIIRRTIYLYAVDVSKIYGEADKYGDFKVAICANGDGYTIDGSGNVKCKSDTAAYAYGLSDEHKARFVNASGVMNQWKIKSGGSYSDDGTKGPDYMFQGERDYEQSFGIYFRRDEGENAGSYTLTACAAQSDIADCRYKPKELSPDYTINWLGDQYEIIEVQGILTIETRVIDITPDVSQSFQYGNYAENGSMPNITFKETHDNASGTVAGLVFGDGVYLFDGTTAKAEITAVEDGSGNDTSLFEFTIDSVKYIIDGVHVIRDSDDTIVGSVNISESSGKNAKVVTVDGTEYTMVQKARCLISISGLITHCISDGQNEALVNSLGDNYWNYPVTYTQLDSDNDSDDEFEKVCGNSGECGTYGSTTAWKLIKDSEKVYMSYNVYADDYSNPLNTDTRKESGTGSGDRYALTMETCDAATVEDSRYSRDVYEYCITKGTLKVSDNVKKTTNFYVYVTPSRRYDRSGEVDSYTYTSNPEGTWVKYGTQYVEYVASNLYARICKTTTTGGVSTVECQYAKDNSTYTVANGYDAVTENNKVYLLVAVDTYNYTIDEFDDTKKINVTAANITVTPVEKQNKIYGEADIEIKFTVKTEYTVARTQYQNFENSNIIKICKDATSCYEGEELKEYRYNFVSNKYVQADDGSYILLTKDWTVILDSFAYDEENETAKGNNLDYGVGATFEKYGADTQELTQDTSTGVKHYDKFTSYKESISTTRILLGNLYVTGNDQSVGEKNIVNGMKIAKNRLGDYYNYSLTFTENIKFVIVPRPVNVSINNITKVYGQATDKESCDGLYITNASNCVVGDGVLTAEDNDSLLINNYSVITRTITDSAIGTGAASKVVFTTTYANNGNAGDGIVVNYTDSNMNMPSVVSAAIGGAYDGYVETETGKYYTDTADASQEKKNDTLNIKVIRKAESDASGDGTNIARGNAECLFDGDKGRFCEDVGEYYLYFTHRSENKKTLESTVSNAYYGQYWGYNPNYYVVVYNNFEASGWATGEFDADNFVSANTDRNSYAADDSTTPSESATLKIRKRPTQMVVETISEYTYTQSDTGTHLKIGGKYYLITDTNTYVLAADNTTLVQKKMSATGTYYLCTYSAANTKDGASTNCYPIEASNRYNLESKTVGNKYSIQQNMDVPFLPSVSNDKATHHTTYDSVDYKNITWYEQPLQVRTGDNLYGEVAYYGVPYTLNDSCKMDSIRNFINCNDGNSAIVIDNSKLHYYDSNINVEGESNFFDTMIAGSYIITRQTSKLYIQNGSYNDTTPATGAIGEAYEANNYTTTFVNGILQIDLDETAPIINIETDFIIKEANNGVNISSGTGSILSFLETDAFRTNKCASLFATRYDVDVDSDGDFDTTLPTECTDAIKFTYENQSKKPASYGTEYLTHNDVMTLIRWFGITSFDPGIIRAGEEVGNTNDRYHARWYMSIQSDFDQRKTGNYTIFVYVQDDVGNISLATTVTLRIVDTTKPTVGTLNLYSAQIACGNASTSEDCTNENNWVVKEDVYLSINSIPSANLAYISDTTTKYMFTTIGGGKYGMVENQYFGTYYKVSAGDNAKAVKHDGWISGYVCDSNGKNCKTTGIYMTVTGGDDNSRAYYDIKDYQRYNLGTNTIEENANGTHIVLGSFVNVDNLTKYRAVVLKSCTVSGNSTNCENLESGATGTTVYIPDKTGSIIRYKGYYYNLASGTYIGTAPTIDEYKVKLYTKSSGVYTKVDSGITYPRDTGDTTQYYLLDGDLYELPTRRYNAERKYGTGVGYTYINLAQWDHYYSRDGGNTWMLYNRDAQEGYLALGEDGQRLIMIKAIDKGFTYNGTNVDKEHVLDAYCNAVGGKTCSDWWGVDIGDVEVKESDDAAAATINYVEYVGDKQWRYNVSDWTTYVEGTLDQDRKYAYLDTILPRIQLDDGFTDIFEYGCSDISNCNQNYQETFGKGIDGYVYKLSELPTYNESGNPGDTHVRINGEYIAIAGRRYKFNSGALVLDAAGEYIYVGNISEVRLNVGMNADLATRNATITLPDGGLFVYDKNTCTTSGEPAVTTCKVQITSIPASINSALSVETADNIRNNTKQVSSGVGKGDTVFDGITDTTGKTPDDAFGVQTPNISDKNVRIFIYADVHGGGNDVAGHDFLGARQYYKFLVKLDGAKYKVSYCTSNTAVGEQFWCATPTVVNREFDTYELAVEAILESYKDSGDADHSNAYNFNGNDIIFSLDYMVFDNAGNASYYQRKIIMLYSFVRYIGVSAGGGEPAAASLSVEVAQNTNVANLLSEFGVVTTSGKNLRHDERILQSIYYNGVLVSSRAAYNLDSLEMLDTSVPGNYKIVYTIERRDGASYAVGNSVELNVTVTPDVASVAESSFNYWYVIAIVCGTIAIGLVGLFLNKKRKIEN